MVSFGQAILRLAPDLQSDIASLMSSPLTDDSDMTDLRQLEKKFEKTNQHLHAINQKLEKLEIENTNERGISGLTIR